MKNYGKHSEVTNAHVKSIMSLPHINNSNPHKIHEFSEKLLSSVQAQETIGKLKEINGYVILTLEKLQGIRADLVRTDDDWQDWKFPQLVEALENWTCRNPKPVNHKPFSEDNKIRIKYIRQINIKLILRPAKNLTIRQQIVKQ